MNNQVWERKKVNKSTRRRFMHHYITLFRISGVQDSRFQQCAKIFILEFNNFCCVFIIVSGTVLKKRKKEHFPQFKAILTRIK